MAIALLGLPPGAGDLGKRAPPFAVASPRAAGGFIGRCQSNAIHYTAGRRITLCFPYRGGNHLYGIRATMVAQQSSGRT